MAKPLDRLALAKQAAQVSCGGAARVVPESVFVSAWNRMRSGLIWSVESCVLDTLFVSLTRRLRDG